MAQWLRSLDLTTHTSLLPIQRGFTPGFVNYKKGCTRLAVASDKVYQLLAHGRWFSPASSTTKTGHHDIAEILLKVALKHQKSKSFIVFISVLLLEIILSKLGITVTVLTSSTFVCLFWAKTWFSMPYVMVLLVYEERCGWFFVVDIDRIVDLLSLNELSSCQGDGGSWWTWLLFNAMVACLQGLPLASIKQQSRLT